MSKNKILNPGINFLEDKQQGNNSISLHGKVVVDKEDWQKVIQFFREYPDQFDKMIGSSTKEGIGGDNTMEIKL